MNWEPKIILTLLPQAEAPADLVRVGFTDDVKKGAHDNGGGTVARPGNPLQALPVTASGPLPVPSSVPGPSSLPHERQVSMAKEGTESEMIL